MRNRRGRRREADRAARGCPTTAQPSHGTTGLQRHADGLVALAEGADAQRAQRPTYVALAVIEEGGHVDATGELWPTRVAVRVHPEPTLPPRLERHVRHVDTLAEAVAAAESFLEDVGREVGDVVVRAYRLDGSHRRFARAARERRVPLAAPALTLLNLADD